ncbi:hypothetical protein NUU61_004249 [Penicillium alfredii]|uniref:Uncharacterized protein n=1 Tax=Penicillium alfredii TaxID=1506179 RepID=A0A9W9FKV3_9EURO|nr:uncharacterized protein NUU61_004249 [Penicillium alfredii]KAJ5102027.1 hypothetical protein NUU61_004249 [Penicillium alfredii]
MECFRQIFRCIKSPFTRTKQPVLEIGPPTNFRKEELPACFSDAESVLSPSQIPPERPNLTNQSQHADVPEQPGSDPGEERSDSRDSRSPAIDEGEYPKSDPTSERRIGPSRLPGRLNPSRWFKSTPDTCHDMSGAESS